MAFFVLAIHSSIHPGINSRNFHLFRKQRNLEIFVAKYGAAELFLGTTYLTLLHISMLSMNCPKHNLSVYYIIFYVI